VPKNVAMEGPDARVIRRDAENDMVGSHHGEGVASHWVVQLPGRLAFSEVPVAPANDLEALTCVACE
jgi:hypothetical protein